MAFTLLMLWVGCTKAIQYGTDFNFKNATVMKDDGWSISNEKGITFTGSGVILDGSKGATTISYSHTIPDNILDRRPGKPSDSRGAWRNTLSRHTTCLPREKQT
jgi:hypothetical protein